MPLDQSKASRLLEALIEAKGKDAVKPAAEELLNFLLDQLEQLRELANGYPRNPIDGQVWSSGVDLTTACDGAADEFARRGLKREEELASRLAAGMACRVLSHYPEQIFPRVFRNGMCLEALGDLEGAISSYEGVVGDFEELDLAELLQDPGAPLDSANQAILEAVEAAAGRLGELQPALFSKYSTLRNAIRNRLEGR